MIANLFSLGERNYINNAVVIADAVNTITTIYGNVTNFKIKFRKPFNTQAELKFSTDPLDGYIVGNFDTAVTTFYFAYTPIDIPLEPNDNSNLYFNLFYEITDISRGIIKEAYEQSIGPMTEKDKVIFVIAEIVDSSIITNAVHSDSKLNINLTPGVYLGDNRLKLSLYINDVFVGDRHSTIKEFKV
jgi:hypothetical protein